MNMKKVLFVLSLTLIVLMSSCVKPPQEPDTILFSVLGDSYSAFEGYVDPETNDAWSCYGDIGVTSVEQMWWHKVATEMEWVMEQNNSFSGSLISNFHDFDAGEYYAPHSFLRRMDDLGAPDVIFVFGGTNDVWQESTLGVFIYENWTDEQLCSFRPAMAYMFEHLKTYYPKAKVYFMLDNRLGEGQNCDQEQCAAYILSVREIASHYGVDCIDLDIHKSWIHPDVEGQQDIARQVLEIIETDFNV